MSLTPLDPRALRRHFERAAASFDAHDALHREVEDRLLERVAHFRPEPGRVLDLGCATGSASRGLQALLPGAQVVALDAARGLLARAQARGQPGVHPVCADLRQLPLAGRSVGLVFANLSIGWAGRLEPLFNELRRVLRPGGLLGFSTLGPDSLHELRAAWAAVDDDPHVHRFPDLHDVGDALVRAGFSDPVMDREDIVLTYPGVNALLRELRATGAGNAAVGRRRTLTGKGRMRAMEAAYRPLFTEERCPATFEVVYGLARAPEEGQPIRTHEGDVATFSVESLRSSRRPA